MDRIDTEKALILAAVEAVERARTYILEGHESAPFASPTDLGTLSPAVQAEALRLETKAYKARPEWAVIQFCLSSSSQLLDVSRSLLQPPNAPSLLEQVNERRKLLNKAKTAGRAAYRAALILCIHRRRLCSARRPFEGFARHCLANWPAQEECAHLLQVLTTEPPAKLAHEVERKALD